jgi:hypothetical protein
MRDHAGRGPADTSRPSVQHLALHLAKDAGKLAEAAEKLDHAAEREDGVTLLRRFMEHRFDNMHRTLALLQDAVEGEKSVAYRESAWRKRAPIITVELQISPPPPLDAEPYWCYNHTLLFYRDGAEVWRRDFPEVENCRTSARVRLDGSFGWVLVLSFTHDEAMPALEALGLHIEPGVPDQHPDAPKAVQ